MNMLTIVLLVLLGVGLLLMFWPGGTRILFDVAVFIVLVFLLTGFGR